MESPLEIRYQGLTPSPTLSEKIQQKSAKLEKFYHRITRCLVTIGLPHRSQVKGNKFAIKIEVDVPHETLIVNKHSEHEIGHENAYVAIRDAFEAMQRQLQNYVERLQQKKPRQIEGIAPAHQGVVSQLMLDDGFGFIQGNDGDELYFHENSVVNGSIDLLKVGQKVRFHREMGDEGLKASSVVV